MRLEFESAFSASLQEAYFQTPCPMSTAAMLQLKQQLSRITEKERQEIAAFLHRLKQDSPAWKAEMTRRMSKMDAGEKYQLQRR